MKKTAKIISIVCCAALFLFLLLPFLETQAPQKAGQQNTEAKAEPQIFTSNPLTELVGRIARFFGAKKSAPAAQTPQTLTNAQAAETFGEPQDNALYASAKPAEGPSFGMFPGDGAAYVDAYLQNEEGEWVLIRQTTPEGASRGMHEVNVKDNAYDRYVHQERQARFTPVMRAPKTKEVPDSKLARVFNPIKRLFGFGEESAESGAFQAQDGKNFAAGKLASSSGLDKNKEKTSILPKARPVDWNGFGNNPFSSLQPGSAEAAEKLAEMILPDAALKDTAEWLANIKFPNADQDPQQQQAKQEFIEQWMREKYQALNEQAAEKLEEKAKGTDENTLFDITTSSCKEQVSSVKSGDECALSGTEDSEPEPEHEQESIEQYKERNARTFYEKTNLHLPPAGITVVLHKTDLELPTEESIRQDYLDNDEEPKPLSAEKKQALDLYHYMQEHCEGNCYWVATGQGPAQELQQTVEAAGLVMKGDPLQRHQQYIDGFIEEQRQNGNLTEDQLRDLRQQLETNQTPYTAYTQQDLQQLHKQTLDLLLEQAKPADAAVPFFTHAANAYQYYNDTGRRHPMFYGEGHATSASNLQERSEALTNEVADFINEWRPIIQEIKQEAAQEGVTDLSAPKIQEIIKKRQQEMKDFAAGNDLGTFQK